MDTIPAPANTFVVVREQGSKVTTRIPVVGFAFVQAPGPVYPLCVMTFGGLTAGRAVLHDSGHVSDPHADLVFHDLAEWERVVDSPGYWEKAKKVDIKGNKNTVGDDGMNENERLTFGREPKFPPNEEIIRTGTIKDTGPRIPSAPKAERIPDKPQRQRKPRIFETNSFWQWPDGNNIWIIPGGQPVPFEDDPAYKKIKQVDFNALKKSGWIVHDPRGGGTVADDDDGSSLI